MNFKRVIFLSFCLVSVFSQGYAFNTNSESSEEKVNRLEIPIQISIENEKYAQFRNKASEYLSGENTSECAKFVNRMFFLRFGKLMFGNAWDLQIKNKEFLDLVWRIPENSFDKLLNLKNLTDRIDHFQQLYTVLDQEEYPLGVIGFVYRYSFYREYVSSLSNRMPQTHITFLAGRKEFHFENESDQSRTLEEILVEKYGVIHDVEKDFVNSKVDLEKTLQPRERLYYNDYLIEEQFKTVMVASLLEVYLRKHRNNRVESLVRPVSYSRVSQKIMNDLTAQQKILNNLGSIEYVSGGDFVNYFPSEAEKEQWKILLADKLGIDHPEHNLLVPVPNMLLGRIQE